MLLLSHGGFAAHYHSSGAHGTRMNQRPFLNPADGERAPPAHGTLAL